MRSGTQSARRLEHTLFGSGFTTTASQMPTTLVVGGILSSETHMIRGLMPER